MPQPEENNQQDPNHFGDLNFGLKETQLGDTSLYDTFKVAKEIYKGKKNKDGKYERRRSYLEVQKGLEKLDANELKNKKRIRIKQLEIKATENSQTWQGLTDEGLVMNDELADAAEKMDKKLKTLTEEERKEHFILKKDLEMDNDLLIEKERNKRLMEKTLDSTDYAKKAREEKKAKKRETQGIAMRGIGGVAGGAAGSIVAPLVAAGVGTAATVVTAGAAIGSIAGLAVLGPTINQGIGITIDMYNSLEQAKQISKARVKMKKNSQKDTLNQKKLKEYNKNEEEKAEGKKSSILSGMKDKIKPEALIQLKKTVPVMDSKREPKRELTESSRSFSRMSETQNTSIVPQQSNKLEIEKLRKQYVDLKYELNKDIHYRDEPEYMHKSILEDEFNKIFKKDKKPIKIKEIEDAIKNTQTELNKKNKKNKIKKKKSRRSRKPGMQRG